MPGASLAADPCHIRPPWHRRPIDGTAVKHRRDGDDRPLVAPQAVDRSRHHKLPTPYQRGTARFDLDISWIVRIAAIGVGGRRARTGPDRSCVLTGHPPSQPRWLEPHPRRRGNAGPRREQPGRGRQQTLRRHQRVDTGQPHERSQRIRQPNRQRPIDDRLRRHRREPLGGPPLERLHDRGSIALRMRLDEHGVDEIVVEFRVFFLDHPRRVDEIHAIPHQRQNPPAASRHDRREPRQEPRPPRPAGQAARHEPVFERHAACYPDERGHAGAKQERDESDTLVVGTGRGQPPGQIAFRFRVRLAVVCPRADGERLGG